MSSTVLLADMATADKLVFAMLVVVLFDCMLGIGWLVHQDKLEELRSMLAKSVSPPNAPPVPTDPIALKQREIDEVRERLNAMEAEFIAMVQDQKETVQ